MLPLTIASFRLLACQKYPAPGVRPSAGYVLSAPLHKAVYWTSLGSSTKFGSLQIKTLSEVGSACTAGTASCAGLHIQFSMALAVICCNGSCSSCSCSSRVCSALYNSQGPNDDNVEAATNSLLPPLSLSVTIWEFIGHGSVTGQT